MTVGESPPDEAINFGSDNDVKFFTIDSFNDAEFKQRRYDLGFGSVGLDKLGKI